MASIFGWCRPCLKWCAELSREMGRSQDGMHDLLCRRFYQGGEQDRPGSRGATVDLFSGDGDLVARTELSGVDRRSVELVLSEGRIVVSDHDGDGYHSIEYRVRESRDEPFRVRRSG